MNVHVVNNHARGRIAYSIRAEDSNLRGAEPAVLEARVIERLLRRPTLPRQPDLRTKLAGMEAACLHALLAEQWTESVQESVWRISGRKRVRGVEPTDVEGPRLALIARHILVGGKIGEMHDGCLALYLPNRLIFQATLAPLASSTYSTPIPTRASNHRS